MLTRRKLRNVSRNKTRALDIAFDDFFFAETLAISRTLAFCFVHLGFVAIYSFIQAKSLGSLRGDEKRPFSNGPSIALSLRCIIHTLVLRY